MRRVPFIGVEFPRLRSHDYVHVRDRDGFNTVSLFGDVEDVTEISDAASNIVPISQSLLLWYCRHSYRRFRLRCSISSKHDLARTWARLKGQSLFILSKTCPELIYRLADVARHGPGSDLIDLRWVLIKENRYKITDIYICR